MFILKLSDACVGGAIPNLTNIRSFEVVNNGECKVRIQPLYSQLGFALKPLVGTGAIECPFFNATYKEYLRRVFLMATDFNFISGTSDVFFNRLWECKLFHILVVSDTFNITSQFAKKQWYRSFGELMECLQVKHI